MGDQNGLVWFSKPESLKQWEISQNEGSIWLMKYNCMALQERSIGHSWPTKALNTDQVRRSINYKYEWNMVLKNRRSNIFQLNSPDQQFSCISQSPKYHTMFAYGEIFTWIKVPFGHFRSVTLRHNQDAWVLIWIHVSQYFFLSSVQFATVHLKYWDPRLSFPLID